MKPGRVLDTKIAEKVFGNQVISIGGDPNTWGLQEGIIAPDGNILYTQPLQHYSTDIAAAWTIVEKLREKFNGVEITLLCPALKGPNYKMKLYNNTFSDEYIIFGDTAPMTICLAALKTLEQEKILNGG